MSSSITTTTTATTTNLNTNTDTNTVQTPTPTKGQGDDPFGWPLPAFPTTSGSQSTMARNSSYFLGFLVTFCVLLVVFIGCGLASRRHLVSRRRGRGQGAGPGYGAEEGAGAGKRGQEARPVWVERWVEVEKKGEREGAAGTGMGTGTEWNRITPLATTIVRPEPPPSFLQKGQRVDIEKQEPPRPQSGSRPLFPALSAWLAQLSTFRDPHPVPGRNSPPASPTPSTSTPAFPSTHPPAPPDPPPAEAHVAVMIAMPLRPENAGTHVDPHAHGAPPEYQIGVACVPVAGVLP